MTFAEEQIAELVSLFPEVQQAEEGGVLFFLIPAHPLPDGCTPGTVDLLLCPTQRDGYPHRLFYAVQVQGGEPRGWNTFHILGRAWHAVSWRTRDGLRLAQMLAAHLDAVRPRRAA